MKKTLSVCLALLMLLSCFAVPTTAFAAAPKKTNGVLRQRRCSCLYR